MESYYKEFNVTPEEVEREIAGIKHLKRLRSVKNTKYNDYGEVTTVDNSHCNREG